MNDRSAECKRVTAETDIRAAVSFDRPEPVSLSTPLPFLTHMLDQLARHGRFGLEVSAGYTGEPLAHHLAEDLGIALGRAIDQALGDRAGVERFGWAAVPMDESLAEVAVDLSGRGGFYGQATFSTPMTAGFEAADGLEFLRALAVNARLTLHLDLRRGGNAHHELEACFKALAVALRQAVARDVTAGGGAGGVGRTGGGAGGAAVPSTKGVL